MTNDKTGKQKKNANTCKNDGIAALTTTVSNLAKPLHLNPSSSSTFSKSHHKDDSNKFEVPWGEDHTHKTKSELLAWKYTKPTGRIVTQDLEGKNYSCTG